MELPDYFIADLPGAVELTPNIVMEAAQTLKRNRGQYLAGRSTDEMIRLLARIAGSWLDPEYPFRKRALEAGPAAMGFSRATLESGLDDFFQGINERILAELVLQDLGDPERLDKFVTVGGIQRNPVAALAVGPELLVQICGGTLPNPTLTSIILGVLLRSAQFIKCARGTSFLPRLFAHSIHEEDRKLGTCIELAEWPGGSTLLEEALFAQADTVTATGSDETLVDIERRLPPGVRFVGYGHRVSCGYVTREALSGLNLRETVSDVARDVAAWDQQGCLSPQVVWVENGGKVLPAQFAEMLARQLEEVERTHPRGRLSAEAAANIASRRSFYELRAANSPDTRLWCSKNSTAWTVVFEEEPDFQPSCLNRFVYVKSSADLGQTLARAHGIWGRISTVGVAATASRLRELTSELARWGVPRICPVGEMQRPPLTWRHDGRPSLGDLVTWTEWERDRQ